MKDVRENAISVLRSLPRLPDAAATEQDRWEREQQLRSRDRLGRDEKMTLTQDRQRSWDTASSATMVSEGSWNSSNESAIAPSWEYRTRRRSRVTRRNSVSTLVSMPSGDPKAALRGLGLGVADPAQVGLSRLGLR